MSTAYLHTFPKSLSESDIDAFTRANPDHDGDACPDCKPIAIPQSVVDTLTELYAAYTKPDTIGDAIGHAVSRALRIWPPGSHRRSS